MVPVIPQPKRITQKAGRVLPGRIERNEGFAAVTAFEDYRARLGLAQGAAPIHCLRDESLPAGAYRLDAGEAVTLSAPDETGMHHALATLTQLTATADKDGFAAVAIEDAADYPYRGLMIDTARIFHPLENLLSCVDLCWLYKLSHLHIHFTDDQSYTLPSEVFPKLPTPGKSYTKEETASLAAYAQSRGVRIMPEIDVPGHCRSFSQAYPEIFTSGGIGHIIAFTPRVFTAFEALFGELAERFPDADRIHIGGDEADIAAWLQSEECRDYAAACGVPVDGDERLSAERIYATFVKKLSDIVLSLGKTPVCWEGFGKEVNYLVPRTTEVFSWELFYQTTPELTAGGYPLINGSWMPNYIVYPHHEKPVEELFNWSPRRFQATHPGSPYREEPYLMPRYDRLLGGELLSWGDHGVNAPNPAAHLAGEFASIAQRLPATAEGAWNQEKPINFAEFEQTRAALAYLNEAIRQ